MDVPRTTAIAPSSTEQAVIVPPAGSTRGAARAYPLRREGPAKLTGTELYSDDIVFPGAW
jgi:hypothetical protein